MSTYVWVSFQTHQSILFSTFFFFSKIILYQLLYCDHFDICEIKQVFLICPPSGLFWLLVCYFSLKKSLESWVCWNKAIYSINICLVKGEMMSLNSQHFQFINMVHTTFNIGLLWFFKILFLLLHLLLHPPFFSFPNLLYWL